jgi:hypothetical protein
MLGATGTYDVLVFLRVVCHLGDRDGATGLLAFLVLACRACQPAEHAQANEKETYQSIPASA